MTGESNTPTELHWTGKARYGMAPVNEQLIRTWNLLWDVVDAAEWRYGNNPAEYHRGNERLDSALSNLRDFVDST